MVCLKCDQELEIAEYHKDINTTYGSVTRYEIPQFIQKHIESCAAAERSSPFSTVVRYALDV